MDKQDIVKPKVALSVIFLIIYSYCTSGTAVQWKNNQHFDGKTTNHSPGIHALNLIHCTRLCSGMANCSSFFFDDGKDLNCFLLDYILDSVDELTDSPGVRYYTQYRADVMPQVSSTMPPVTSTTPPVISTTPQVTPSPVTLLTTLTSAFSHSSTSWPCPDIYSDFTVQLNSNVYTFKVSSASGTFFTAASACESDGGFLARVNTLDKLNYLDAVLSNCQTYAYQYIRIDGTNMNASDFHTIHEWRYSDYNTAVMTSDIVSIGYPYFLGDRHCLVMNLNDKIQDYNCKDTADTYVCEKST